MRDGRIAVMGVGAPLPAELSVVSGEGRTLIPGLIDSHTHVFGDALRSALVFGVTTELDMFTNSEFAAVLRQREAAGQQSDVADLRSAGTLVTAPGGHGTQYGFPIPTDEVRFH